MLEQDIGERGRALDLSATQLPPEVAGEIREYIERARWARQGHSWDRGELAAHQLAAAAQRGEHARALVAQARFALEPEAQAGLGRFLRDAARVAAGVTLQRDHRLDDLARTPREPDAPAGHGQCFGDAVHGDRARLES